MRRTLLSLIVLACLTVCGQRSASWEFPVEGDPVAVFNHEFTGIPIAETTTHYYGINFVDKKPLWTIAKGKYSDAAKKVGEVAAMTGSDIGVSGESDFFEIPFTPFASIKNKFIDISTGNILIGEGSDAYSSILDNNILAELYILLVKVKAADGSKVLYCIDLQNKSVTWKTKLADPNALKDAVKHVSVGGLDAFSSFAPKATGDKDIVYKNDKTLFLIDSKSGSIKWQNECNPGTFFLDPDQKFLVVVKQASSLGSAIKMSLNPLGKTIFALDIKTGKDLWKKPLKLDDKFTSQKHFDAGSFIAAHKKGMNIVDYATGNKKWKKDFETNRIQEITIEKEGLKVFYGNKIMLVNAETGKKAWKKPIEFDAPEDEEGNVIKKSYGSSTFIVGTEYAGLFDSKTGKKVWKMSIKPEAKVAFDNKNNKVAIVDGKKFYLFNPLEVTKKVEKIKLDVEKPNEIIGFDLLENGYFITGLNEFFLLGKKGEVVSHQYYKQLKTDRLLKAALTASSVATGILATEITVTNTDTGESATSGLFMSRDNAKAMGDISQAQSEAISKLKEEAKLRGAVRSDKNYAYFLKGVKEEEQDQMFVVKVNKTSGKEVDSFNFGNDRKVIYELNKPSANLYLLKDGALKAFNLE